MNCFIVYSCIVWQDASSHLTLEVIQTLLLLSVDPGRND